MSTNIFNISLIIGQGEVGRALYEVLASHHSVLTKDKEEANFTCKIDVLHIAYPYSNNFVKITQDYIKKYKPQLTIVYSTVPIGTCDKLGVVHSPIEGRHPDLAESIRIFPRWLGCKSTNQLLLAEGYWYNANILSSPVPSAKITEFLKLRSTAKYGVNLAWTDYEKKVADKLKIDFDHIKCFDNDYNQLYEELGEFRFKRYILDPPNGKIGGYCIIPNAKILNKQFPSSLLEEILELE